MYGKEWLTLHPHFYQTDSVNLDAKGMELKEVSLVEGLKKTKLNYNYDGMQLKIKLNKAYKNNENYILYFEYISKPNELMATGSAAITDAKGLYFINPKGEDKTKPTQIWTQGETESNSAWMITIDKPNQKSTEEINMTVPDKYVTLSNGLLISQKKNTDGTRTDNWKMDLPHAPYLFFMGVGEFAIIKDSYKGKEVSYYVEKDQQPFARGVFGNTPEMIGFFSNKLGIEFPWQKYAQIVGRDYVSGAMENTTATLHQESAYQNARELTEGNDWEETIAHELFHQWFGDLVTCESWSNITVNESFANYSEYLWDEYKHGKDFADEHNFDDMQGYLMSRSENKDLVRFYYSSREDVFDGVSYNKGGRILHMLRNYVGDEAFFKSLNNYLNTNKFKNGEAHQLRLAFEEVTGMDMNWFWNQWYYGSGHPKLKINYNYYDSSKQAAVIINQTQKTGKTFILPMAIDVYVNGIKTRYQVTAKNTSDTFYFNVTQKPEWINVDADKILLAEKIDNKSEENYIAEWKLGKNYLERKDALDYFAKKDLPNLSEGLNDNFYKLQNLNNPKIIRLFFK
jgi:aminopeptidase N